MAEAKDYAHQKYGKELKFDMETFEVLGDRRKLREIGADSNYYDHVFQSVDWWRNAKVLRTALEDAFKITYGLMPEDDQSGRTEPAMQVTIDASNYDKPSLKQLAPERRLAVDMALIAMANAGVRVRMDHREVLDLTGQWIPVPGEKHPFVTPEEMFRLKNQEGLVRETENSPVLAMLEEFRQAVPVKGQTHFEFLDNEDTQRYLAMAWEVPVTSVYENPIPVDVMVILPAPFTIEIPVPAVNVETVGCVPVFPITN